MPPGCKPLWYWLAAQPAGRFPIGLQRCRKRPGQAGWRGGAAAFGVVGTGAAGGQALQQLARRFVGRVLLHQFAAECLGQQRQGQLFGSGLRRSQPGFEAAGEGEQ